MRKYKNFINCVIYAMIIIVVSQLTTYSVDYNSTIQYLDDSTKDILLESNLNTVNNEIINNNTRMISPTNYEVEVSLSKNETPIVTASMTSYPNVTIWTNKETNVYSKMDINSDVVDTLYQGYNLQVEEIDENWCRILSTDTYITTDSISYNEVTKNLNITEWVTCDLNLRSEPNTNSQVIQTLEPGSTLIVNDFINDEWSKVTIGDLSGFVQTKYLSETEYVPPKEISLGTFKITHYCDCSKCCGKWSGMGITASGAKLEVGTTIAVDPDVIPYGTKIMINGHVYTAQDCGGGVNNKHIDIYVSSHEEALQKGTYTVEVFKVIE